MLRSFFREGQSCLHCIKPIICIRSSRQPLCSTQWSTPNINQCLSQRHSERRTCNFLHKGARCTNIQPCSAVSAEKHFVHGSLKCRKKLKCFKKNHYLWKQLCGRWHCMVIDSFSNVQSGRKFCVSNWFLFTFDFCMYFNEDAVTKNHNHDHKHFIWVWMCSGYPPPW